MFYKQWWISKHICLSTNFWYIRIKKDKSTDYALSWKTKGANNSYFFVNGKEIFKFNADDKNFNFPTQFYLQSIPNGYRATESKEVSLNEDLHDFSVNCNFIDKFDILNIKYFITKNNTK